MTTESRTSELFTSSKDSTKMSNDLEGLLRDLGEFRDYLENIFDVYLDETMNITRENVQDLMEQGSRIVIENPRNDSIESVVNECYHVVSQLRRLFGAVDLNGQVGQEFVNYSQRCLNVLENYPFAAEDRDDIVFAADGEINAFNLFWTLKEEINKYIRILKSFRHMF